MARKSSIEIVPIGEVRPYVLWRRVSTEGQGKSELGLSAQTTIAKMFMGKDPIETFTDVFSGTKLRQCKGLWAAIALCRRENYVLVIAKSDRCRNVSEALEILDAVGERNILFCDLPTCDRFILTVMWAMWERQAIMGRINTKIALSERKKQIAKDGGFVSKSGNWTTHLGRAKGCDLAKARRASSMVTTEKARAWRRESPLYIWVENQVYKNRSRKEILAEAAELYEKNPDKYCTREGKMLCEGTLSYWVREIQKTL